MSRQEQETDSVAAQFYSGAERRIVRMVLLLGGTVAAGVLVVLGVSPALGFGTGLVLALFNLQWLHRTSERATASIAANAVEGNESWFTGMSLAFGLVLRLTLVSAAGYAIFKGSRESFYGFLCGLAMPVCALFAEALYETWVALRRGL